MTEIGSVYGELTVIEQAESIKGTKYWKCLCSCGELRIVAGTGLRAGRNKSCGCKSPRFKAIHKIDNEEKRKTRTYKTWLGMHARCNENNIETARYYKHKGIKVCKEWDSFDQFYRDMGEQPEWATIDRIDGNKGYSPENCRWATYVDQNNNLSSNRHIEIDGKRMTIAQWARETNQKSNSIVHRLRRGWSDFEAIYGKAKDPQKKPVANCKTCGKEFNPRPYQLKIGSGKFCSRKCIRSDKSSIRATGKTDAELLDEINQRLQNHGL